MITTDFRGRADHLPLCWKRLVLERALFTQLFYSKHTSYWAKEKKKKKQEGQEGEVSLVLGNS